MPGAAYKDSSQGFPIRNLWFLESRERRAHAVEKEAWTRERRSPLSIAGQGAPDVSCKDVGKVGIARWRNSRLVQTTS